MKMPPAPQKNQKVIEIIAGPNGSGKTTFAEFLFKMRESSRNETVLTFVNPDIVAAALSPVASDTAAIAAGRIVVSEVQNAIREGKSFAFESTLSGRSWASTLKRAKNLGYEIRIYFIALYNIRLNLSRIKKRVASGGHDIPTPVVRRRHPRVFKNFWKIYKEIAADWYIFDNSKPQRTPELVLSRVEFEKLNEKQRERISKKFVKGLLI